MVALGSTVGSDSTAPGSFDLNQHSDSAEHYNKALSGLNAFNDQIANAYDFPEGAVVVDIGGGQGDFLRPDFGS